MIFISIHDLSVEESKPLIGSVQGLFRDFSEDSARMGEGASYELLVQLFGNEVLVKGVVSSDGELECVRCAEFYSTKLVDCSFVRSYPISELTEEVDISEDVREAILLQIPSFPICQEGACKGLCSCCGKKLDQGDCGCVNTIDDSCSSAFDALNLITETEKVQSHGTAEEKNIEE